MSIQRVRLPDDVWAALIVFGQRDRLYLEGNILKVLDPEGSPSYQHYVETALALDRDRREKRRQVTKQVQEQNKHLNETYQKLQDALVKEQESKRAAEEATERVKRDLDYMQKRTQFELMERIVRVALVVILGVGGVVTVMYAIALFGISPGVSDITLLSNTWSNMLGILLTNSFSIIGTIMGIKYTDTRSRGNDLSGAD